MSDSFVQAMPASCLSSSLLILPAVQQTHRPSYTETPAQPLQPPEMCTSPLQFSRPPGQLSINLINSCFVSVLAGLFPYVCHGICSFVIVYMSIPLDFEVLQELGVIRFCPDPWLLAGVHIHSVYPWVGMGLYLPH